MTSFIKTLKNNNPGVVPGLCLMIHRTGATSIAPQRLNLNGYFG